jgi:hypothetical protein
MGFPPSCSRTMTCKSTLVVRIFACRLRRRPGQPSRRRHASGSVAHFFSKVVDRGFLRSALLRITGDRPQFRSHGASGVLWRWLDARADALRGKSDHHGNGPRHAHRLSRRLGAEWPHMWFSRRQHGRTTGWTESRNDGIDYAYIFNNRDIAPNIGRTVAQL